MIFALLALAAGQFARSPADGGAITAPAQLTVQTASAFTPGPAIFRGAVGALPVFEFAPATGAGMGQACACSAAITGSRGEPVTFTRASSAYCTKGNEWSGISNGSLVLCSSNQPLVMPGGDGTGPLGTLEEDALPNLALQSQSFDQAAWANFTAGSGVNPTKGSADTDIAPDGTTTAERVTFAVTGAGDSSGLQQSVMMADGGTLSIYAKDPATLAADGGNVDGGGATGGTFDLAMDKASGVQCGTCSYVATTWTRCYLENVPSKSSGKIYIGNLSSLCGGTTRAVQTPALWGAQAEPALASTQGSVVTSYIPTGAAIVTRAASRLTLPVTAPVSSTASAAGTVVEGPSLVVGQTVFALNTDVTSSNNSYSAIPSGGVGSNSTFNFRVASVSHSANVSTVPSVLAPDRFSMSYDGAIATGCMNGSCVTAAATFTPFFGSTTMQIGRRTSTATTFHPNRVIKQICFDATPGGCIR